MSQKATRKSQNATTVAEEKEKADTPVKEMKKKIAANAEKDKQAAEKTEKQADKTDKNEPVDKNKPEKTNEHKTDKPAEKVDKNADKPDKNADKSDKTTDKLDKNVDKPDKNSEKSEKHAEKSDKLDKATDKKADKSGEKKADKSTEKKSDQVVDESKGDKTKEKVVRAVNGHNGAANGEDTVSDGSDGDLVIEEDEAFPELTYDDTDSDVEDAPSRSLTRRSQPNYSKGSKMLETVAPSDRKLRSADSPKPDAKKTDKKQDSPRKQDAVAQEEDKKSTKKDLETNKKDEVSKKDLETKAQEDAEKKEQKDDKDEKTDKMDVDVVVVEAENSEGVMTRTRARVSPYSRTRLDRTTTSVMADYTGNNSTMEMDITESSSLLEDPSLNDSGYLRGLRAVRGRSSYKLLKEIKLTNPNAGRPRPTPTAATIRPLGAVVGRKRKPSGDSSPVEIGEEATDDIFATHGKRMKLLDRLSMPFRRSITRRAAEIVGINTDLPLTAPVASSSFATFDPETIKPASPAPPAPDAPLATPLPPPTDRDGKRCIVM